MESTTESITSTALPVEANASTESPDCKTTFDPHHNLMITAGMVRL